MGKRRQHEASNEEIERKIKKLTRKLEKRRKTRSTSEESSYNSPPVECQIIPPETFLETALQPMSPAQQTTTYHELQPSVSTSPYHVSLPPPDVQQTTDIQSPPENQVTLPTVTPVEIDPSPEDVELDEDILTILGDAPKDDTSLGPAIHKDIANRWREILLKGLTKDIRDNLLKEYLVPNNCNMLLAPNLNPEVKAALPEALSKRDFALMFKQKQLGIALSALASTAEMIINNETSKQKILKPLSDACRLLCNKHFEETRTRRDFVISSINTNMKEALIYAQRDTFLFGENLNDKLKTAKNIQRSGETLRNTPKIIHKTNFNTKFNKGNLNSKPLHRKTDFKNVGEQHRVVRQGVRQPAQATAAPRAPGFRTAERPGPPRQTRRR